MTDCRVYVIAFVKLLCEGNDPTNPAIDFGPSQIQNLRNQIVVHLSHEYITQQAIAKGLIDPTLDKPPVSSSPPSQARLPTPFPLSIDPLPQPLSKPLDQTLPSQLENDEYCPSINSWGMWGISGNLYYPAQIVAADILMKIATLRWLEPNPMESTDSEPLYTTFQETFQSCHDIIDDLPLPLPTNLVFLFA